MVEKKTTIQISQSLKKELDKHKMFDAETYEQVIWDFVEDRMVLSKETLAEIEASREEARQGKTITHEELKRKLGL